jgi:hypothetical protein
LKIGGDWRRLVAAIADRGLSAAAGLSDRAYTHD